MLLNTYSLFLVPKSCHFIHIAFYMTKLLVSKFPYDGKKVRGDVAVDWKKYLLYSKTILVQKSRHFTHVESSTYDPTSGTKSPHDWKKLKGCDYGLEQVPLIFKNYSGTKILPLHTHRAFYIWPNFWYQNLHMVEKSWRDVAMDWNKYLWSKTILV